MRLATALQSHRRRVESLLIVAVVAVALVLRLAYALSVPNELTFDEPTYNDIVTNLLTGRGYSFSGNAYYTSVPYSPTSFQEPMYPLFLVSIYRVTGLEAFKAARVVQAILNTISVILMMLIASRIWNRGSTIFVGAIAAVYIPFLYFTGLLMTENLFIFWLLIFVCLCVTAFQRNKTWWLFAVGVSYGIACLTCGMFLFFLPILLPIILYTWRRNPRPFLGTAFLLAGVVIAIAPWTYRNYLVQNAFVPITTKAGYNLYVYTYPAESLDFNNRFDQIPIPQMDGLTEIQRASNLQSLAIENIKAYPLLQLKFALYKLLDFWNPLAKRGAWYAQLLYVVMFAIVIALAIFGVIRMFRSASEPAIGFLLVSLILFHVAGAAVFTGGGKARLPIEPLLILLAGGGFALLNQMRIFSERWMRRASQTNDPGGLSLLRVKATDPVEM